MKLTQELLNLCHLIEKVSVPAEYTDEGHKNAYRMGYKHGLDGSRKVNTGRFLIKSHADAYNAGYNAGKSGTSSTDEAAVPKISTEFDGPSDSITVMFKGEKIGTIFETRGVWNAIDKKTGKTWEFCKSKSEAIRKLVAFNDLNEEIKAGDHVEVLVGKHKGKIGKVADTQGGEHLVVFDTGETVSIDPVDASGKEVKDALRKINEAVENRRTADQLEVGDEVEITGKVNFQGELGEIVRFGKDKRFVVVRLQSGGDHSFHSSDVSELNNDYADDSDTSTEVDHNKFYVAFYDKDEERSWIGLVTKEHGGQWHEKAFLGKPIYRWGHTHPTFLTPDDILAHLHKDLPRSIEIEGPYYDADEAKQHVAHNWGKLEESLVTEARALTPIQMNKKAVDILIKHGFKKESSENQPGAFATWLNAKDADINAAAKELGLKDHPHTKALGYTRLLNSAHHELSISGKSAHFRTHKTAADKAGLEEAKKPEAKVDKKAKTAHLAAVEIVKKQGLKPVNVAMSIKGGADIVTNFLASKNISSADAKKIAKALSMTEPSFAKKLGYDPATLFTNKAHEFRIHGDRAILRTTAVVKEGVDEVVEATEYMKYADWKQAVLLSHPAQAEKIKFRAKMEGEKTIVSAVVPGVDHVYGMWDDVEEIGTVLAETTRMENLIADAKMIISKAWADLGKDLAGYSVRDLLLDNMPLPSKKVDEILKALRDEGYID